MLTDERIYEEPEYAPPSRKTLLAIMRRKIGRGLQTLYEPQQELPPELKALAEKLGGPFIEGVSPPQAG
jgi:hypothetical protein